MNSESHMYWATATGIVGVFLVCVCGMVSCEKLRNEGDLEAAKVGLEQQVVEDSSRYTHKIWVKPSEGKKPFVKYDREVEKTE